MLSRNRSQFSSLISPCRYLGRFLFEANATSTTYPYYHKPAATYALLLRHASTTPTRCEAAAAIAADKEAIISEGFTETAGQRELDAAYDRLNLSFEDGKEAFKSKTNAELLRAIAVLNLCSIDFLVRNNKRILSAMRRLLGERLFRAILRATFFGHFLAGETQAEVAAVMSKLDHFGVKSILDYSVEADVSRAEVEARSMEDASKSSVNAVLAEATPTSPFPAFIDQAMVDKTRSRYSHHHQFADRRVDVMSARTYIYTGENECDKNAQTFCDCIDAAAQKTEGRGFVAVKLTALGRPKLLLHLSETIAQTQNFFKAITGSTWETLVMSRISEKDFMQRLDEFGIKSNHAAVEEWFKVMDFDDDGFVDFYDWGRLLDAANSNPEVSSPASMFQVLNIKTGRLEPLIKDLTKEEAIECNNMLQRMVRIAEHSASRGIRIMIDAEQTYLQPAISRLTVALMRRYNRNGGQVLNTYQAYLRGTLDAMQLDMHLARRYRFHFGCKLVRGAYMEQERRRAATIGYEDPVNPTYEATTQMYYRCLDRLIEEHNSRGSGQVSVMVASHNEDTVRYAVGLMRENGIHPDERVLCFAQLYGMCDQATFSLGQAGYSVYKYLPYGPLNEVLPYLARRAQENGAMFKKSAKERRMLWAELKRRLADGQFTHPVVAS